MSGYAERPGIKFDGKKPRWCLFLALMRELGQVAAVLSYGSQKYADNNWIRVKPRSRYWSALYRHLAARAQGERNDSESGLPHLAHALCCLLFLAWADNEGEDIT